LAVGDEVGLALLLLLLLVELGDVERLVDVPGDGLDLGAELLLDPVQGEPVVVGDRLMATPR